MYSIQKNPSGKSDIVINGFEKGIASSPYVGIANIQNLNTSYYPGVAYVNYKRQACSLSGIGFFAGSHSVDVSNNLGWIFTGVSSSGMENPVQHAVSPLGLIYILDDVGQIWKQSAVNSNSFNKLTGGTGRLGDGDGGLAFWNNYLVVFGDGLIEFCGDGTGDAGVISTNWNLPRLDENITYTHFTASTSPSKLTIAASFPEIYVGDPVQFTTTGTLPAPLALSTTYYVLSLVGTLLQVSLSPGGAAVVYTTTGTGVHTITDTSTPLPLGNITDMTFTGDLTPGSTSATITAYTTPSGAVSTGEWQGATGQYNIISPRGDNILGVFTRGSATVTFLAPIVFDEFGTFQVELLSHTTTNYRAYVSKVDGNLYFANGRNLGRILSENVNTVFKPNSEQTYTVNFSTTAILQQNDIIVDMMDLKSSLIVAGNRDIYTWDYISSNMSAPVPISEQIVRIENLLNNIYVTAGQKGNIYVSNGYSAQALLKLPDFIAGVIDPVWSFGGMMVHRAKLYFQALAQTTAGANILAGVFSINVSPTNSGDVNMANAVIMESQNSYGLTPSTGASSRALLIDNEPSASGCDSYYSAYSSATSSGGIDYNDTTLWQNFEPSIETDIIPIGDFLSKRTLGLIEFKLDRPLATGDQIRMYSRISLSDTYTLMGTTTTAQLSDYYQTNIFESQWAQFKVQFKCASSSSSFVPLREIRIHLQ